MMIEEIKAEILKFRWSDYGLDAVETADPEYAEDLAWNIRQRLTADGT